MVIDKDGVIITGHTRYKAAKKLGLETVPTITADDLSEEKVRAYRLADNKAGEESAWNSRLLSLYTSNEKNYAYPIISILVSGE